MVKEIDVNPVLHAAFELIDADKYYAVADNRGLKINYRYLPDKVAGTVSFNDDYSAITVRDGGDKPMFEDSLMQQIAKKIETVTNIPVNYVPSADTRKLADVKQLMHHPDSGLAGIVKGTDGSESLWHSPLPTFYILRFDYLGETGLEVKAPAYVALTEKDLKGGIDSDTYMASGNTKILYDKGGLFYAGYSNTPWGLSGNLAEFIFKNSDHLDHHFFPFSFTRPPDSFDHFVQVPHCYFRFKSEGEREAKGVGGEIESVRVSELTIWEQNQFLMNLKKTLIAAGEGKDVFDEVYYALNAFTTNELDDLVSGCSSAQMHQALKYLPHFDIDDYEVFEKAFKLAKPENEDT